jgi:glycosyltransferase involved in cell wall biosynthesis
MNSSPKIAILLATYNGRLYVRDLLASLQNQSFRDFTIFVRDDGSCDGTPEVIDAFRDILQIVDIPSRCRLGAAGSFFELLKQAQNYDLYFFADQDDYWLPDKVSRALKQIGHCNGPALYTARIEIVDEFRNHLAYSKTPSFIGPYNALVQSIAPGCTMALNSAARALVLFPNAIPDNVMHDRWCYFVISACGKVVYDSTPIIQYRIHGSNTIGYKISFAEKVIAMAKNFTKQMNGVYSVSSIAACFLDHYSDIAPKQILTHLRFIYRGRYSLKYRFLAATAVPLKRRSRIETIVIKAAILLNFLER